MTVLLLRPSHKLDKTCMHFQQAGQDCVGIGLMGLTPGPDNSDSVNQYLQNLNGPLICIFTSQAAVENAFIGAFNLPPSSSCYAVGKSTANMLATKGITCITPELETSEGLLALLKTESLHAYHLCIFKGVGGRQLLKEQLAQRCASFHEFNLYRREIITQPEQTRPWQKKEIHCIVATSGEMIEAAFNYFDQSWLKSLPWVVVSRRLAEFATTLGIQHIVQSAGARDQQLIDATNTIWSAK